MRTYTSFKQSKKLAEILSLQSADMHYERVYFEGKQSDWFVQLGKPIKSDDIIPCWSLTTLLDILPYPSLAQHANGLWSLVAWVDAVEPYSVDGYDNKIDVCVAMIMKLYELKKL